MTGATVSIKSRVVERLGSLRAASQGVVTLFKTQLNAWIHLVATVFVIALAFVLRVSAVEWCVLVIAIAVVWVAEAMNTALEFLCDVAAADYHPLVKRAKDTAAGAVLLAALGALVVGALVLVPHLLRVLAAGA